MAEAYLALDVWQALGLDSRDFDAYYERNGWANTWANLLAEVRSRRGRVACPIVVYGEPCELIDGHIGPHMGASDLGSSEALPVPDCLWEFEDGDGRWLAHDFDPNGVCVNCFTTKGGAPWATR